MKANWADPENTRADMRMVATGGHPASVAYAPNVTANAAAANPSGKPARMPARQPPGGAESIGLILMYYLSSIH